MKEAARHNVALLKDEDLLPQQEKQREYNKVYYAENKKKASDKYASVEGKMKRSETDIRMYLRRVLPPQIIRDLINDFLSDTPKNYDWIFVGATIEVNSGRYHNAVVTRSVYRDNNGDFVCDIKYDWARVNESSKMIKVELCREKKYYNTLRSGKVIGEVYVKPREIKRI